MKNAFGAATVVAISMLSAGQAFAQAATQDIDITATVPGYCRINGSATPGNLSATVPVDAVGAVTTTAIPFTVTNVVCNTASNVLAELQSGGVKSAAAATAPFTNIINYTGAATLGSATSTINTATVATASAAEAGNTASTGGAVSGSLSISVTPHAASAAAPLVAGSYSDVLRVTLTPIP